MKKFLLSFTVIAIFAIYILHQKMEEAGIVVVPPSSIQPGSMSPTQQVSSSPTSTQTKPTSSSFTPTPTIIPSGTYKNGTFTGDAADAFYGNIQVQVIITNGKINDVVFLQYPNDRGTSVMINSQAMPYLKQEAIAAQNANVDIVSGATDSSLAFRQSLQSALSQAK